MCGPALPAYLLWSMLFGRKNCIVGIQVCFLLEVLVWGIIWCRSYVAEGIKFFGRGGGFVWVWLKLVMGVVCFMSFSSVAP